MTRRRCLATTRTFRRQRREGSRDKVVVASTLKASKTAGDVERIPVMAIWRIQGGKVISLREVDGG